MKVTINHADLTRVKLMFTALADATPRIVYRAINKTEDNTQTFAVAEIGGILNLPLYRIRNDFIKIRAYANKLSGEVIAKGKPINLASFSGTTQTLKGISVKIFNTGTRILLKHGFIWERRTSGGDQAKTAFWRSYGGARKTWRRDFPYGILKSIPAGEKYRLPLETLTGPRIEDIYARDMVIGKVQQYGAERYVINTEDQINYEYSRLP